jgi:hypothetical protein
MLFASEFMLFAKGEYLRKSHLILCQMGFNYFQYLQMQILKMHSPLANAYLRL